MADLSLPGEANWAQAAYHLFVVRTPRRVAVLAGLLAAGVETLIHYPIPCHLQGAFADLGFRKGDFPLAERLAEEVLSLPFWPGMGAGEVEAVAAAARAVLGSRA